MSQRKWAEHPRWEQVVKTAEQMVAAGEFRAVSFQAYEEDFSPVVHLGERQPGETITPRSLYLVASLTKPVVATAVLQLVQAGLLSLNERVADILPEWNRNEKRRITVRHLLCHTSGLPDQLPENLELRDRGAPLAEFYEKTVEVPLEFPPGSQAQYQSMGFVVLARIVEQLTGKPLSTVLHEQIFEPLGMTGSYLGFPDAAALKPLRSRIVEVELDAEQQASRGNWNSDYWLSLGAPWGGMLSTPVDLLKFCVSQFGNAALQQSPVISPGLAQEAFANQLGHFEEMNARDRQFRPWGLGWRLNWKAHRETFGDLLSEDVVGHWGATGTLMWVDDRYERACVICTSRPSNQSRRALIRLSNSIQAVMDTPW